ncbi:MAG: MBL fold metallo-hydrolase [Dehalococcoidales bacterium]|nr:MBL fold metallo-hydrolase [Dehalococcoidales bacterium]
MDIILDNDDIAIRRMVLGQWDTNSYIVACKKTGKSALVDAPDGAPAIIDNLNGTVCECIFLTHNHIDHTGGLKAVREKVIAPLAVHPADNHSRLAFRPEMPLNDGDAVSIGEIRIDVIHTPGHTPGSICLKFGNFLLAGDTLFPGGPGRTDSPADFARIIESITQRLFVLPGETLVYPGHGGHTTIKTAREEYAAFSDRSHDPELCGDVTWTM